MEKKRSSFTSKLGFVLTAAGSAVGLGNIWRFPYLTAKYGGGIFLLVYLILVVTFGFTLMIVETALGRKTGLSAIGAYQKLDKRFTWVGILSAIVPAIILPYYSVIGGWVSKYLVVFVTGEGHAAAEDAFFNTFSAKPLEPLAWFLLFIGLTALVVLLGVDKGVEKVSTIMMPILILLTLLIAIYAICMPGALDGLLYYITPDFSKFSANTVLAAMGQMFYSMSLAMGIMITYGSYMKKELSLEKSVRQIEFFDTGIAFLAGMMIVPSVYVFSGGNEEAMEKGASLMFVTLPKVFDGMVGGQFIGALFFLMVLFAALTSSISLMETIVSVIMDKFHLGRKASCLVVLAICLVLGIPSSLASGAWKDFTILGMHFRDFCDFISNSVIMPVIALITCLFVGYVLKPGAVIEEVEINGPFKAKKLFVVILRYIAPVCIVLIMISSILDAFGIMSI